MVWKLRKLCQNGTKQFSGEWRKESDLSIRLGSSSVTKKQDAKAWTGKIQSLEDQKEMQMPLSDWYFLLYQRNYALWISSLKLKASILSFFNVYNSAVSEEIKLLTGKVDFA
jgi:hypothetical protein